MKQMALVTGAAKNIGKGIAEVLLSYGYDCILLDKDEEALKQTTLELKAKYKENDCFEYVADLSKTAELEALVNWLFDSSHDLTALVNNAAYESAATLVDLIPTEIAKTNATNLEGPFYLASLIARQWIDKGIQGKVIFISSTHSKIIRTHPLYSASKAAIEMFVREAGLELAAHGVRVNAVAPGPTQDTEELKPDSRIPLGYVQQPKDIGEVVAFLMSDKARFITGQSIIVDGGFSLAHTHHWLKNGKFSA